MSKITEKDFTKQGEFYVSDLITSSNTMLAMGITSPVSTTIVLESSIDTTNWSEIPESTTQFTGYEDIRVFDIHPKTFVRIKSNVLPTKVIVL